MNIVLYCQEPALIDSARKLCKTLKLKLYQNQPSIEDGIRYFLGLSTNGLALHLLDKTTKIKPIYIDFTQGRTNHRRLYGGGKSQLLAKACGVKNHPKSTVIDATAGFGSDAFVLATLGYNVHLIERNPIIWALLDDAIARACQNEATQSIAKRMQLHLGQAIDIIPKLPKVDVIYMDPMYPLQKKSALVKKELRLIREIVGHDTDSETLFACACQYAAKVVVKRAKSSPTINQQKPDHVYKGQRSRFDVYTFSQ